MRPMTNNPNRLIHAKPKTPTLPLDSLGGASYSAANTVRLRLKQRRLRFFHLAHCSQLLELDVSACAESPHITIERCPNLRRIRVPDGGDGAVIHIDAGDAPPVVAVSGPVRLIDACWAAGQFDAEARRRQPPFRDAAVGLMPGPGEKPELLVLAGRGHDESVLELGWDGLRQVVVTDLPVQQLALLDPLERVWLERCAELSLVEGSEPIHRLRVTDCSGLSQVTGTGHSLRLHRSGTGTLRVTGEWQQFSAAETEAVALEGLGLSRVMLRDCPSLIRGRLASGAHLRLSGDCRLTLPDIGRLELDERAVAGLLERLADGDRDARDMLYEWCGQPVRPRQALDAIKALARVADPAEAEQLWLLRCRLHAANNLGEQWGGDRHALRYGRLAWEWRFPHDLSQEGWNADLRLWNVCRRTSTEARACDRLLARGQQLSALVGLVQLLLDTDSPDAELRLLLLQGLSRQHAPPGPSHGPNAYPHHGLERLLQGVVALRDQELADALLGRIVRTVNPVAQLNMLGTLTAFGHTGARARLMALGQHFGRDTPGLRARAVGLALAPVRTPIFEQQGVNHAS